MNEYIIIKVSSEVKNKTSKTKKKTSRLSKLLDKKDPKRRKDFLKKFVSSIAFLTLGSLLQFVYNDFIYLLGMLIFVIVALVYGDDIKRALGSAKKEITKDVFDEGENK